MNVDLVIVQTTFPAKHEAKQFLRAGLQARLFACGQMTEIESVYRWEGAVEEAGEVRVDMKTPLARAEALKAFIATHHPYDEPEVVVMHAAASAGYGNWVEAETKPIG